MVRWHADGGRVPAPPSLLDDGERANWAHAPSGDGQLASPMALLHVLAETTAATREDAGLLLPGGVRAVPPPPTRCQLDRRSQPAHFAGTKLGHFTHLANRRCKAGPISRSRPFAPAVSTCATAMLPDRTEQHL